jgi:hypothetical protein
MRRLINTLLMLILTLAATAQTAREEIRANKYLAGSNYLDYERQRTDQPLTPAPEGYVPFYMSHYGRHGSRWLIGEDSYTSVIDPLEQGQKAEMLTQRGMDVLRELKQFEVGTSERLGDLTTVGERQHHGIGQRMAQNFPEIFKHPGVAIDARSTIVIRCILSMTAECEELMAANPTARIHNDVSNCLQYYLNQPRTGLVEQMSRQGHQYRKTPQNMDDPGRLMGVLFKDVAWAREHIDTHKLAYKLFEVVTNMQSHDNGPDLYDLFTEEELYQQWRMRNIGWYLDYGPAPQSGGVMPFSQRNLLRNIIETADTITQTQATLRFGHEVCVMPLACLLELDSCAASVTNLDELDRTWRNYKIFPMACNIQLVFYRPQEGEGDILVKALLNEREATLPIATDQYPYYKWADLRSYYLKKLDAFEAHEAASTLRDAADSKPIKSPINQL